MSTNDHDRDDALRQELLEFAFDCHPDPDAVQARIDADPRVAALFAEARATAELLQQAATAEAPPLDLATPPAAAPAGAPARAKARRRGWTFRRTWVAAAALVAVAVLPALGMLLYRAYQLHDLRTSQVRLVVSAPSAVPDGTPLRFHVETVNLAKEAMRTDLAWKVLDEKGETLTASTALCDGTTDIEVAGSLNKPRKLVVTATAPGTGFSKTITQPIHPTRSAPMVHLTSDKPAYRPGEAARLRVACLDRLTLRGADHIGLLCRVLDPKGGVVQKHALGVGKGVAAQVWDIPADAAGGKYRFEVRDQKDRFTLDHIEFLVRNFQPPALKKTITLDRQTYAAGQQGSATLEVDRLSGGKAAGAKVRASLVVDGEEAWHADAVLDYEGRAKFTFLVPGSVLKGAARLVAKVTDGGRVETAMEPFVIPTDKVEVRLYPEGGDLVAGAENRVYAQVRDPLGRPLSGEGEVVDDQGKVVAPFRTVHMGRARFAFTPEQGRAYKVRLVTPIEKDYDLPAVKATGVVLRAAGDYVAAGKPIAVRVFASGQGPWIASAFCRGVLVGQKTVLDRGLQDVEIPVVATASGVLRVTVFDRELRPVAERLVQREAEQRLTVALSPAVAKATPGSKQKVTIKTSDETGEPVSCFVGLTITDKAVADMVDFIRTGLLDQQQLWTDVEQPDDKLEEFLAGHEHRHRNVDLLLGSLGWRRYVWKDKPDDKAIAALGEAGGEWAKALPVREGRSWAPVVTDTMAAHTQELREAQWARREARDVFFQFATAGIVLLLLVGGTQLLVRLARWWGIRPHVLVGSTAGVGAALVAAAVVLQPRMMGGEWVVADAAPASALVAEQTRAAPDRLGFFYDDGGDGDVRGRSENFFGDFGDFGDLAGFRVRDGLETALPYIRDFDIQIAQGATVLPTHLAYYGRFARTKSDGFFLGAARSAERVELTDLDLIESAFDSNAWNRAVGLVANPQQRRQLLADLVQQNPGLFYALQPPVGGKVLSVENNVATLSLGDGRDALRAGQAFAVFDPTDGYRGWGFVEQVVPGAEPRARVRLDAGAQVRVGDLASTNVLRYDYGLTPALQRYIVTRMDTRTMTQMVYRFLHKGGDGRGDFAETLFWQPFLVTDEKGEATVEFDVSDSITTWNVHADAHGGGRIGQATATFASYTPFHMTPVVPQEVSEGDRLRLPVAVVADDAQAKTAAVAVTVQGPLSLSGKGQQDVPLRDGRGRAVFDVLVGQAGGDGNPASVGVQGQVGKARDAARMALTVVPRGFPYDVSRADRIGASGKAQFELPFPDDDLAKRTAVLRLRFFPSPLADLEQAIQGMLREPGGCFEQVSSSNYPNVMALSLLQASGDDVPAAAARAQKLLASGYKQLVAYEVDGGGFEWWGKKPAHAALTAYGLMQFTDMAKVFDVDAAMVARTRAWLLGKRDGKGGFVTGGGRYGHFQGGSPESRSSYIAYALLYAGEPAASMTAEIAHLVERSKETDNGYELAVAACALEQAGHAAAAAARERLAGMQEEDGAVPGKSSITGSGARDLRIETTGFAVLAWLADPARSTAVQRAVDFLAKQRQGGGHFGATQATVMALKALSAYANSSVQALKPGAIIVRLNGKEIRRLELAGTEKRVIEVDVSKPFVDAPAGARKFELELTGGNSFPYALDLGYRADLPNSHTNCALGLRTYLSREFVEEGDAVALHAVVENKTKAPVANPMVIVGLPAGLHVTAKILDDLKKAETIAAWELRGRDVVLYLRGLEAEEKRDITIDVTGRIPGKTSGPASRAYLYYTAEEKCWADPLRVEVKSAR